MNAAPIVQEHDGIMVVRDDLFPGGTKARFIPTYFDGVDELVYATPAQGGAQTALAYTAQSLGKRATLFVAKRKKPHARTLLAKRLGARIFQVPCGYMTVLRSRASLYCQQTGAKLVPFGVRTPEAINLIARDARLIQAPDEVWCAAGSGVLATALKTAWPTAQIHAVQVGRVLTAADVLGAKVHVYPKTFDQIATVRPPFPSDPHYDAKAWEICRHHCGSGRVLFWNVTGPA